MDLKTFSLDDIKREIRRELEMRRKVWPTVTGMPERFLLMDHQRKYDILNELSEILENGPAHSFKSFRDSASENKTREIQRLNKPNLFTF